MRQSTVRPLATVSSSSRSSTSWLTKADAMMGSGSKLLFWKAERYACIADWPICHQPRGIYRANKKPAAKKTTPLTITAGQLAGQAHPSTETHGISRTAPAPSCVYPAAC